MCKIRVHIALFRRVMEPEPFLGGSCIYLKLSRYLTMYLILFFIVMWFVYIPSCEDIKP